MNTAQVNTGWHSTVRRTISAALVAAALVSVGYWGHHSGWRLHGERQPPSQRAASTQGIARVEFSRSTQAGFPTQATITFDSAEAIERAGIDVSPVWTSGMTEAISANGELQFDPTLVARPSARSAGTAWRVFKSPGQSVRAGELIAIIDAAEVGKAKSELQLALVQLAVKTRAAENRRFVGSAGPERLRTEAEAAVKEAEVRLAAAEQALINLSLPMPAGYRELPAAELPRRLRVLGLEDATELDPKSLTTNLLPVRSTIAGVVVSADVVNGEPIEMGKPLFTVVDARRMWLTLHVSLNDVQQVKLGQTVVFQPDGASDEHRGTINWIGAEANESTRTVPVRLELANPTGQLRASTLGRGKIIVRVAPEAVVVPNEAVHLFQGMRMVFIRDPDYFKPNGPKSFHTRFVRVGVRDEKNTEILEGIRRDEVVATKGSMVLLGELVRTAPVAKASQGRGVSP